MGLKLNLAGAKLPAPKPVPTPTPKPAISPHSREFERVVEEETREADRLIAESDAVLAKTTGDTRPAESEVQESNITGEDKLSRLVDDEFPFDDTQLTAIHGLVQQQYGVMIGAAGTGKTTTTKKLVDLLRDNLDEIDVSQYWKRGEPDEKDDYEVPEKLIPSIALVSFTGRATQMIKKNFPRDWHGNIMTIHRALGFYPEYYQDFDEDYGEMVNKRRFVPAYNEDNLMPWDIIVIDEAGMLGLELWHQLWAATKSTCRIIMIGDINQLPPTHGKSILGFAMTEWPVWELTHVHRQQGANNSIVDNAHRILKGLRPASDSPEALSLRTEKDMLKALNFMATNKDWRFLTVDVPEEHRMASLRIRQCLQLLQGKIYEPNRDVLITPINGYEQTAPGYSLGQAPLNQELVVKLNSKNPRYLIDAGRERQNFAVGDKVMATVNDYGAGITNGMTGIVKAIEAHGGYIGDARRWGLISEVNDYLSGLDEEEEEHVEFSLDQMVSDATAGLEELKKKKEKPEKGPSSHVVTVEFGEGEHAFEIAFNTKSTVASLMLAYAATCHKMQGGECPLVFAIVHQGNKSPLNREWYYTAVTRASERCVVFTTRQGQGFALGKQNIKGVNLAAKIKVFADLTKVGLVGASVKVKLPKRAALTTDVIPAGTKEITSHEEAKAHGSGAAGEAGRTEATQEASRPVINIGRLTINIVEAPAERGGSDSGGAGRSVPVDGGTIRAEGTRPEPRPQEVIEGTFVELVDAGYYDIAPALPAPSAPESLPFGGKSIETLAHEHEVASLRVPPAKPLNSLQLAVLAAKNKPKFVVPTPKERVEQALAKDTAHHERLARIRESVKPLSIGALLKNKKG